MYRFDLPKQPTLSSLGLTLLIVFAGCRTPWQPASTSTAEPVFDDLLSAERSQLSEPSGQRDPIASRLKSADLDALNDAGGLKPPPPHMLSQSGPDTTEDSLASDILKRQQEAVSHLTLQREAEESSEAITMSLSDREESTPEEQDHANLANFEQSTSEDSSARAAENKPQEVVVRTASAASATGNSTSGSRPSHSREHEQTDLAPTRARDSVSAQAASASPASSRETMARKPHTTDSVHAESQTQNWRDHVRSALAELAASYEDTTNPEQRVNLEKAARMLNLTVGDLEGALEPVDGLDRDAQEYLRYAFQSLHDVTDPGGNPTARKRYSLALQSQRKALQYLASASDLEVRNTAFCTSVDSYGDIKQFDRNVFSADQEVLLYCEVDNFVSRELPADEGFETHLKGSYEIVNSNGGRIDDQPLPADQHVCANQRRDYFIVYRLWMPKSISPGKYKLNLTVEDLNGRKFGHSSIDFTIE